MKTCQDFEEKLFLFKELNEADRQLLDQHLQECESCSQIKQGLEAVIRLYKESVPAGDVEIGDVLHQRIMQDIQDKPVTKHRSTDFRYVLAAASLLLCGFFIYEQVRYQAPQRPVGGLVVQASAASHAMNELQRWRRLKQVENPTSCASLWRCVRQQRNQNQQCEQCQYIIQQYATSKM